jgi:hypothetical protein
MRSPRTVSLTGSIKDKFLAERDRMLALMQPAPPVQVAAHSAPRP